MDAAALPEMVEAKQHDVLDGVAFTARERVYGTNSVE